MSEKYPLIFIQDTLSTWLIEALLSELERRGLDDLVILAILCSWAGCVDRCPQALRDAEYMVPEALRVLERVGRRS